MASVPGVVAVSPQITGAGFLTRGGQVAQVSVNGLEPGRESAIVNLRSYMVEGSERLGSGIVVLGESLAEEMSLRLGQTLRLQSSGGASAVLTLGGIYDTGNGTIDGSSVFVSLATSAHALRTAAGCDAHRDQAVRRQRRRSHRREDLRADGSPMPCHGQMGPSS